MIQCRFSGYGFGFLWLSSFNLGAVHCALSALVLWGCLLLLLLLLLHLLPFLFLLLLGRTPVKYVVSDPWTTVPGWT